MSLAGRHAVSFYIPRSQLGASHNGAYIYYYLILSRVVDTR